MSPRVFPLILSILILIPLSVQSEEMIHVWSQNFGDSAGDGAAGVAVDSSGNVFLTGEFQDTIDLGGGPLLCAGVFDIFVAKFDPNGNHLWSRSYGGTGSESDPALAVDQTGNVIITGDFENSVDFGGGPLTSAGGADIYLVKIDSDGNHVWSQRFGDSNALQSGECVCIDSSGNVVVSGSFGGTADFGGGTLTCAGAVDIFLAQFDPDGAHLWSRRYGDQWSDFNYGLAVDWAGNIVITGGFYGSIDFGGGTLTSAGYGDIYLAKFDNNANHLWSDSYGDSENQSGQSVRTDGFGNILLSGGFLGTVDFGGGPFINPGSSDVFLVKFLANGSHSWSRSYGDSETQTIEMIMTDREENILLIGVFGGTIDFGGGLLTPAGGSDVYVAKLDPGGDHVWSERFGGDSGNEWAGGIAVSGLTEICVAGGFNTTIDFGGGPLTSAGLGDAYLAKLVRAPALYIVCPNGSGDFGTIQEAVDYAANGDTLELCDTVFTGPGNRDIDFSGKSILLRSASGNPSLCVIDCEGSAGDPHRGFLFTGGEESSASVAGINIRNGYAVQGGAVYCDGSSPTFRNVVFSANSASDDGGAIYCYEGSSSSLSGCTFFNNWAGDNGAGAYFNTNCNPVIDSCLFRNNVTTDAGGGLGIVTSSGTVTWCIFHDNTAGIGGAGMFLHGYCTTHFENCTFSGNTAPEGSGCLVRHYSTPTMSNCVVAFGRLGDAIHCTSGSGITLSCCDVYANAGGDWADCIAGQELLNNNFSADPFFCFADTGNYYLDAASPCLDAPGCGLVGALGEGCDRITAVDEAGNIPARYKLYGNRPNPFNPTTTIRFALPEPGHVRLTVHDVSGREIATLVNGFRKAKECAVEWHGKNDRGDEVGSGVYFVHMVAGGFQATRKIVLVR